MDHFQAGLSVPGSTVPLFPTIPTAGNPLVTSSPGLRLQQQHDALRDAVQPQHSTRADCRNGANGRASVGSRGVHELTQVEQNPADDRRKRQQP